MKCNKWVSSVYIPGTQNTEADSFSRNVNEAIVWKSSTLVSKNLMYVWKPNIRPLCLPHKSPN